MNNLLPTVTNTLTQLRFSSSPSVTVCVDIRGAYSTLITIIRWACIGASELASNSAQVSHLFQAHIQTPKMENACIINEN